LTRDRSFPPHHHKKVFLLAPRDRVRLLVPKSLHLTRKKHASGKYCVDVRDTLLNGVVPGIVREPSGEAARTKVLDYLALQGFFAH
jgi:hypothetical protein